MDNDNLWKGSPLDFLRNIKLVMPRWRGDMRFLLKVENLMPL